jgi:L-ascorbate metabolism protein UlaG (beta-lactamase superfamily)
MQVEWYGQSAFQLTTSDSTVFIDPFGDVSALSARGLQFDYPPIKDVTADVVLVTHEHLDHNAVDVIGGSPLVLRSTAGRLQSPIGEIVAVASEHDTAAGTERGPNTIFVFELDHIRVCHLGDFGQSSLREEQVRAIGAVDLLFVADTFLEQMSTVQRIDATRLETDDLRDGDGSLVVVPSAP